MAQFITPAELKSYPLPVTAQQWAKIGEDQLIIVIGHASDHLEQYMDRTIAVTEYTDRFKQGSGSYSKLLSCYPVVALTDVTSFDGAGTSTTHNLSDFYINKPAGIVEWVNTNRNSFSKYRGYNITYTAGYGSVPGPVKYAAALQTVKMLQPLFRGGANFTEMELISDLDEQIVELLDYFKRRRIG